MEPFAGVASTSPARNMPGFRRPERSAIMSEGRGGHDALRGLEKRRTRLLAGGGALLLSLLAAAAMAGGRAPAPAGFGVAGEARPGGTSLPLTPALGHVAVTEARGPGRPLVVIDPGHGGGDPGAAGVSGEVREKDLTLLLARELRQRLAASGRVRVALTREGDSGLPLDTRAAIARSLGADLFLSIHADSAANPLARGATVYSLSEVASDADAARFAATESGSAGASGAAEGSVRALLADLAVRDEMNASADFAVRLLGKAPGRIALRPEPHQFAAFRVLRRAEAPAVLFEAGYLSNAEDEAMLRDPDARARMIGALAGAIETEMALARASR
uniref:N-acetylmuramoyl-L-alanine amidase family protein n=1 Tax=uncultured Sphingomonas sp. TaxID=158754 RepID=UPI0025E3A602|nr:N-acetylmuramoyl-L-alanine amidase [uncultured Sphingomonas sp.]